MLVHRHTASTASPMRRLLTLSALTLTCAAAAPAVASANLWVAADGTDSGYCSQANPCATVSRAISLAIPNDTIYVGPGRFQEHPTIDASITGLHLQGAGMHATILSGGFDGSGTVLTVAPHAVAEVDDLTITGGSAPHAGGVLNDGNLTMQRDDITGNAATGDPAAANASDDDGSGGGIESSGPLSVSDSSISANQATYFGGGVASIFGALTLDRDLIASNTITGTPSSSDRARGAGVFSTPYTPESTLQSDTIINNLNPAGTGGGVLLSDSQLTHDTIAGNVAAFGAGVYGLDDIELQASVLSNNRGGNCGGGTAATGDLSDDTSCHGSLDISGDPHLAPLADNGGPTETMAITSTSLAYDASTACAGTDERGVSLLQRGATSCDLGAYQVDAPTTYVANRSPASVNAYSDTANGNAAPVLTISGSATGLKQPTGVATDAAGDVFVADPSEDAISEFAPEASGNVAPIRRISGTGTRLNQPQDVAVDDDGTVYVTNLGSNAITEYAPSTKANVSPVRAISGAATKLSRPTGIVIGPDGNLHVANDPDRITTYSLGEKGNAVPVAVLKSPALNSPRGLNFDPAGRPVVASSASRKVLTFAGDGTVAASLTGLSRPFGLDLGLTGDIFVTDPPNRAVLEYAPGATTPTRTITGAATGLSSPAFLSELPPTPAPQLRLTGSARSVSRARLLAAAITVGVHASGRLAFRDRPVRAAAVARVGRRTLAVSRSVALRPGTTTMDLRLTGDTTTLLKRHHRTPIVVTLAAHDAGGTQRRTLTITSAG